MVIFDCSVNNSECQDMEEQTSSFSIAGIQSLSYELQDLCGSEPTKKRAHTSFLSGNHEEELEQSSKKFCNNAVIDGYIENRALEGLHESLPKKENCKSGSALQDLHSPLQNISVKEVSVTGLSKQNENTVSNKNCWPISSPGKLCGKSPKKRPKKILNYVPPKNQMFINSYFVVSPKSDTITSIDSQSNRTLEDKNLAENFKRKLSFSNQSTMPNELELISDEHDSLFGITELNDGLKGDSMVMQSSFFRKAEESKTDSVKCLNSDVILPENLGYTNISLDENSPMHDIERLDVAGIKEMNQSYVIMFETILEDKDKAQALDFISRVPSQYPPPQVLNIILYEILQKTADEYLAHKAFKYVNQLLNFYPPDCQKVRKYYLNALQGKENNMFDKMSMIIKYSLCECGVQLEEIPSECQNNILLLEFLLKLFHADFTAFEERARSPLKKIISSKRKNMPLVMSVFWPMGKVGIINSKCSTLLQYMNDIFKCNLDSTKLNVLALLQKLLTIMAECCRLSMDCHKMEALNNPHLNELNEVILRTCQDAMENVENLKIFLIGISPFWLQMKLCEKLLYNIIFNQYIRSKDHLSLRKIVRQYMYPPMYGYTSKMHETDEDSSSSESEIKKSCNPNKRNLKGSWNVRTLHRAFSLDVLTQEFHHYNLDILGLQETRWTDKGETPVHRACMRNDSKCLAELLAIPGVNINAEDNAGWTPIHEACLSGNYRCVELLLHWQPQNHFVIAPRDCSTYVNILASTKEGTTILHDAVEGENIHIVKLLLKFGGHCLLHSVDSKGRIPVDLSESHEMLELLKAAEQERFSNFDDEEFNFNGSECSAYKRKSPHFVHQAHHDRYLFLLNLLLSNYVNNFHIQNLVQNVQQNSKSSLFNLIGDHLRTLGYPQVDLNKILYLCDDIYVAKSLPKAINTFVEEITNAGTEIPKEIFSLKLLGCVLSVL